MGETNLVSNIATAASAGIVGLGSAQISGHQNRKFAREQREYATDLSNTAYQRGMKDMRKAGLNPMLAYMKGGADSPQGHMAQTPVADVVTSAKQGLMLRAELAKAQADAKTAESGATILSAKVPRAILEEKIATAALEATLPIIDNLLEHDWTNSLEVHKKKAEPDILPGILRGGLLEKGRDWYHGRHPDEPSRKYPQFKKSKEKGAHRKHQKRGKK